MSEEQAEPKKKRAPRKKKAEEPDVGLTDLKEPIVAGRIVHYDDVVHGEVAAIINRVLEGGQAELTAFKPGGPEVLIAPHRMDCGCWHFPEEHK